MKTIESDSDCIVLEADVRSAKGVKAFSYDYNKTVDCMGKSRSSQVQVGALHRQ